MERIGIAASRMAKGSLIKYNLLVVLIASTFATIIFLFSSASLLAGIFVMSVLLRGILPAEFHQNWMHVAKISLTVMAVLIGVLNLVAIGRNVKIHKP